MTTCSPFLLHHFGLCSYSFTAAVSFVKIYHNVLMSPTSCQTPVVKLHPATWDVCLPRALQYGANVIRLGGLHRNYCNVFICHPYSITLTDHNYHSDIYVLGRCFTPMGSMHRTSVKYMKCEWGIKGNQHTA